MAHDMPGGLLASISSLSFDDSVGSGSTNADLALDDMASPSEMIPTLLKYFHNFTSLKHKWTRVFTEVEACCGLLIQDIKKLQLQTHSLQSSIGPSPEHDAPLAASLWQNMSHMNSLLLSQASTLDNHTSQFHSLTLQHTLLSTMVTSLENDTTDSVLNTKAKVSTLNQYLYLLDGRLLRLLPLLQQRHRGGYGSHGGTQTAFSGNPNPILPTMTTELRDHRTRLENVKQKLAAGCGAPPYSHSMTTRGKCIQDIGTSSTNEATPSQSGRKRSTNCTQGLPNLR